MKKPIVIILALLLILAGAGGLYATGNLDGIIDKIFNHHWKMPNKEAEAPEVKIQNEFLKQEETTQIKLYFNNKKSVKEGGCESTASVVRTVPNIKEAEKMAEIAINMLIDGPTKEEKQQGYSFFMGYYLSKDRIEKRKKYLENEMLNAAAYEDQVKIKSIEIKKGVAYVDFNLTLYAICVTSDRTKDKGACLYINSDHVISLQTAIDNTLKQFSEIKDVVITVEGEKYPCSDSNCFKMLEFELGKTDVFIETVQQGEGITHLARRALDKYLKQISHVEEIKLTETQKLYAEDYIQNEIGSEFLKVGQSKEFSAELIKEAILNSQNLSLFAQQGLNKYLLFNPTSIETGVISNIKEDSATIWFRYLDPNNHLIRDAKVSLILTSPEEHEYDVIFSKINNYYYTTLYYVSLFKNLYCFQIKASKGIYESQHKELCTKLYIQESKEVK